MFSERSFILYPNSAATTEDELFVLTSELHTKSKNNLYSVFCLCAPSVKSVQKHFAMARVFVVWQILFPSSYCFLPSRPHSPHCPDNSSNHFNSALISLPLLPLCPWLWQCLYPRALWLAKVVLWCHTVVLTNPSEAPCPHICCPYCTL